MPSEAERLETLRRYRILDTDAEPAFDDLTRLAALICGTPMALISLIDERRQWFKSRVGLDVAETPREIAFCARAIEQSDLYQIEDAQHDDRFRDNPLVTGPPHIRFYAGAPLVTREGHALGTLCVLDRAPRTLTEQQRESLDVLGRHVARLLERRRNLFDLAQALGDRARAVESLEESEAHYRELALSAQAQQDLFANLLAVARATMAGPGLDETLQGTIEVAKSLTGAQSAELCLLDEAGRVRENVLALGTQALERRREHVEHVMRHGLAGWVARERRTALIPDTRADGRWLDVPEDVFTIRSALCVPISSAASLVGVLTLAHPEPRHFTEKHQHFVEAAAEQVGVALHYAERFEATRRMAERQGLLYDALRTIGGELDPDRVAQAAVRAIAERTAWLNVAVSQPGPDGRHWQIRASAAELAAVGQQPIEHGVVGRAFASGRTQRVRDVREDPDYVQGSPIIRSELAVPLRRGDRVLGVLNVESDAVDAFGDDDVRLAESLADAVALALDNALLYRDLQVGRERLQALIGASHDGIMLVAPKGELLVVNPPMLRLLDLRGAADAWVGRSVRALIEAFGPVAPGAAAVAETEIRRFESGDEAAGEGEYEVGGLAVHWQNLPVSAGGVRVGRLIVLRDVSGERQLERAREDLTHMLVHDLRSPLTSIRAGLDYLAGHAEVADGGRSALEAAQRASDRLQELVSAILEVSHLESGSLPFEPEPVDVGSVIGEVVESTRPQIERKGLSLDLDLGPELPPVSADPGLLARVVQNLLGNAIKFTPEGGALSVSARQQDGDVRVSVSDTGPGIPAALVPRLFQKFVTGDVPGRGTGLGLALCRLAVEAHGGRIGVAGAGEGGARFWFSLPIGAREP